MADMNISGVTFSGGYSITLPPPPPSNKAIFGYGGSPGPTNLVSNTGVVATDVKAYAMGADYHFSKRTALGVNYRNVDAVGTANDVKQVGVGVTHRF